VLCSMLMSSGVYPMIAQGSTPRGQPIADECRVGRSLPTVQVHGGGAHRSAVTKSSAVVGVVPGSERQAAQVRHLTEPSEQCGQEPFQDEAAIPA
jgi:hypothetical protein